MRDMFYRETEYFRRTKRYLDVNNDEEFCFRFEQMKIELMRITCLHDLKRQEICKTQELMKNGELMMEVRKEWERYLENVKMKRLSVEGLSKLICF